VPCFVLGIVIWRVPPEVANFRAAVRAPNVESSSSQVSRTLLKIRVSAVRFRP